MKEGNREHKDRVSSIDRIYDKLVEQQTLDRKTENEQNSLAGDEHWLGDDCCSFVAC